VTGGSPGIDELNAGAVEVGQVAGGQCGTAGTADGCDKRVEPGDSLPGSLAGARDYRVLLGGCLVNRQYLVGEGPEYVVGGI
jgi:hypothetical protein